MSTSLIRSTLAAALVVGLSGAALARGGGSSGDGLSPYSALSGNDRSAGVNNGNYRAPELVPRARTRPLSRRLRGPPRTPGAGPVPSEPATVLRSSLLIAPVSRR